jgi:small redox-active disulfide protein 2
MKIEILGTGCAKCNQLETNARAAAQRIGAPFELTHVRDIREFARRGVIFTPALAVDGKVIVAGRAASDSEIERMLRAAANDRP